MATQQQQAFQRWSIPDVEGAEQRRGQSLALAPTIRADSLDAVASMPPPPRSFRVYTPAEMKLAPPSRRRGSGHDLSAHAAPSEDALNLRVLLKWTGIGVAAGMAVLATLVLILNFADDTTTTHSASSRAAIGQNLATPALPSLPAAPVQVTPTTIELGTAAAAPATPAPKAKKKKSKKSQPAAG